MTFPLSPARWNEGEIPEETASYGKDCSQMLGLFKIEHRRSHANVDKDIVVRGGMMGNVWFSPDLTADWFKY